MTVKASVELVTPEIAEEWLRYNSKNRTIRETKVDQYAADMKAGRWAQTHQSIGFYEDGILADGQHRLKAIIRSGVALECIVGRGIPREAAEGIDQHTLRSAADSLQIAGAPSWVTPRSVSAARFMVNMHGASSRSVSVPVIHKMLDAYSGVWQQALEVTDPGKFGTGGIVCGYACALYAGVEVNTVREFHHVVVTGIAPDETTVAAIRVREFLMLQRNRWSGMTRKMESQRKFQNGLRAYIDRRPLKILKTSSAFAFPPVPLPLESPAAEVVS